VRGQSNGARGKSKRQEAREFWRERLWEAGFWRSCCPLALAVSLGEIHISPEEIHKSSRGICISFFDLCISLAEICIFLKEIHIPSGELGKSKRKTTSGLKVLRLFKSR